MPGNCTVYVSDDLWLDAPWFQFFWFHPKPWGKDPIWLKHILTLLLFNHHLDKYFYGLATQAVRAETSLEKGTTDADRRMRRFMSENASCVFRPREDVPGRRISRPLQLPRRKRTTTLEEYVASSKGCRWSKGQWTCFIIYGQEVSLAGRQNEPRWKKPPLQKTKGWANLSLVHLNQLFLHFSWGFRANLWQTWVIILVPHPTKNPKWW